MIMYCKRSNDLVRLEKSKVREILSQMPKSLRYDIVMAMNNFAAQRIPFLVEQESAYVISAIPQMSYIF